MAGGYAFYASYGSPTRGMKAPTTVCPFIDRAGRRLGTTCKLPASGLHRLQERLWQRAHISEAASVPTREVACSSTAARPPMATPCSAPTC